MLSFCVAGNAQNMPVRQTPRKWKTSSSLLCDNQWPCSRLPRLYNLSLIFWLKSACLIGRPVWPLHLNMWGTCGGPGKKKKKKQFCIPWWAPASILISTDYMLKNGLVEGCYDIKVQYGWGKDQRGSLGFRSRYFRAFHRHPTPPLAVWGGTVCSSECFTSWRLHVSLSQPLSDRDVYLRHWKDSLS